MGLMVLSDCMVHFLKIETILINLPKLSCGFNPEVNFLAENDYITTNKKYVSYYDGLNFM